MLVSCEGVEEVGWGCSLYSPSSGGSRDFERRRLGMVAIYLIWPIGEGGLAARCAPHRLILHRASPFACLVNTLLFDPNVEHDRRESRDISP